MDKPIRIGLRPTGRSWRAQLVDLALQREVLALELAYFGLKLLDACAQTGDFVHLALGIGRCHVFEHLPRRLLLAFTGDIAALVLTGRLAATLGVLRWDQPARCHGAGRPRLRLTGVRSFAS